MSSLTIQQFQALVRKNWTQEAYTPQFQADLRIFRDFDHALKHVIKATGKIAAETEQYDHDGCRPSGVGLGSAIADLIISAVRLANTSPSEIRLVSEIVLRMQANDILTYDEARLLLEPLEK